MTGRTGRRKQRTITGVFLRYICVFGGGMLLWLLLLVGILIVIVAMGEVLPADYAEVQLRKNVSVFQESPEITEEMIPVDCTYGVYEQDGGWMYGTFSGEERRDAWEQYETKKIYSGMRRYYRFIERDKGEVCIVNYPIRMVYRSPLLRKYLPRMEILLPMVYLVLFLLHTVVVSRRFGKYMKDTLEVLNEVTGEIRKQNLEFEKRHSELKEVEEVLESMYQMKEALRESLFRQWDLEKRKEEQIAALAHDIRTPLTVIRGNAELLEEGELAEAEQEYNRDILQSVGIMEEYLTILNELLLEEGEQGQFADEETAGTTEKRCTGSGEKPGKTEKSCTGSGEKPGKTEKSCTGSEEKTGKTEKSCTGSGEKSGTTEKRCTGSGEHSEEWKNVCGGRHRKQGEGQMTCGELADRLEEQARLLASGRRFGISFERTEIPGAVICNENHIARAFQNIVSNAMDHSPPEKEIRVSFSEQAETGKRYLAAAVMDEGKGFSEEDLRHALERFYRGDKSRSGRGHYGIGLHTASELAQAQGGHVTVENRGGKRKADAGGNSGGKVTLFIRTI